MGILVQALLVCGSFACMPEIEHAKGTHVCVEEGNTLLTRVSDEVESGERLKQQLSRTVSIR